METVKASIMWSGPGTDVLTLFREPTPEMWQADLAADPVGFEIAVLRTLDADERETGEVAGVEIVGLLTFDRWRDLPKLPILWQVPEREPLPLAELLKQQQYELREQWLGQRQAA